MTEADERLLAGLRRGDEAAFAAVYDRFGTALFRAARALLGSSPAAEDCVQDVFVGLVRARRALPEINNLRAYLFTALRHAAARHSERARRLPLRPLPFDEHAELADRAAVGDEEVAYDKAVLEQALAQLPAAQREVVVLKISGGLTFAEIAAALNIRLNTAASRYRYALEKLRQTLQEERHG
jgi:RNA polymerase sigma-70 factor (ECF subfamily)